MPRRTSYTPAALLATLAAFERRIERLQREFERRRAAGFAAPRRPERELARTAATYDLTGAPDTPGVPRGHPLHDPHRWAALHDDALLTQAKLVRYERWLRLWAKRGRYDGGTQLVRVDDSVS
jgi:hypothetical protein